MPAWPKGNENAQEVRTVGRSGSPPSWKVVCPLSFNSRKTVFASRTLRAVLTGMGSLVDLEVLGTGKHFAAGRKRAGERLFSGVHPDVIDQLVLGLEGPPVAGATEPEAGVGCALGAADVVHRQVGHNLLHRVEHLVARFPTAIGDGSGGHGVERGQAQSEMVVGNVRFYPKTLHLLLDGRRVAHVPEECSGCARIDGEIRQMLVMNRGIVALVVRMGIVRRQSHTHLVLVKVMIAERCSRVMVQVIVHRRVMKQGRWVGTGGAGRSYRRRGTEIVIVTLQREEVPRVIRGHVTHVRRR